jgi:Cu-Zn family superoxide dismutase
MYRFYVLSSMALLMVGCGRIEDSAEVSQPQSSQVDARDNAAPDVMPPGQLPHGASAEMAATRGHTANGALAVTADTNGIRIHGAIQGLPPEGEFGFHVHERGDCSAPDASSAGEHFNPANRPHGHPDSAARHAGDMFNLKADAKGIAQVDTVTPGVSLHEGRATDVLGKALVIHAKPDDYASQPAGNSGDRIACGVITVQPETVTDASASR